MNAAEDVFKRITWANMQSQQGNYAGAAATLEEALLVHPDEPQLHYHLAFAYWTISLHDSAGRRRKSMEKGSYRKAIKEFELFLAHAPNDPRAADARMRLELLHRAQFGYRPKR